jgi:uncharacterized protein involved in tolerance to divalent cations
LDQISSTLEKDVPSLMKMILDAAEERENGEEKVAELVEKDLIACQEKNQ